MSDQKIYDANGNLVAGALSPDSSIADSVGNIINPAKEDGNLASIKKALSGKLANADMDTFGTGVVSSRSSHVTANFSFPISALDITQTTSTGTITQNATSAILQTTTGASASAKAVTNQKVLYRPGHEVYAMFTPTFTAPTDGTNVNYQRLGLYDANDGFWFGYNKNVFGFSIRRAGVDTFTALSAANGDTLSGAVGSAFTRGGVPEAINHTLGNLWRLRFGWLGFAPINFEVASPDGGWVTVHTIRYPNTSATTSIQTPSLPMTLEVNKTASDATNLSMTVTCIEAGLVSNTGTDAFNIGTLGSLNSTVQCPSRGQATATVAITGTWVGAIQFEGSNGDGNWYILNSSSSGGIVYYGGLINANAEVIVDVSGHQALRAKMSAYTSGTATVSIGLSPTAPHMAPRQMIQGIVGDNGNSTTVQLASGATFTGTASASWGINAIQVYANSDTQVDLYVEQGDGTNWDFSDEVWLVPNVAEARVFTSIAPFYRIRAKNNGAATTTQLRILVGQTPILAPGPRSTSSIVEGSINALNGTMATSTNGYESMTIALSGTWVGTLVLESSLNGGTSWYPLNLHNSDLSSNLTGFPPIIQNITANGQYTIVGAVPELVRMRASAWSSGTVGIAFQKSIATPTLGYGFSSIVQNSVVSPGNTSTANLTAGSTFTGTAESCLGVAGIKVCVFTDQNSTVYIDQSPNGTNWDITDSYTVSASTGYGRTHQAVSGYYRVRLTNNGASTTTALRLTTYLCPTIESVPRSLTQDGNLKVAIQGTSDKPSYSAAASAFTVGTGPTDIFTIYGSATKTIRITKITTSQTQTTAGPETFNLYKRTATPTGGTRTACVVVPYDSSNAAGTATVGFYTGATPPTVNGTATLLLFSYRGAVPSAAGTSTGSGTPVVLYEATRPTQAIVLRGTAEGVAINGTAVGNICSCTVEWSEE